MKLSPVPADVARAGLRALKTVCLAHGGIAPLEARFLDAVQRHILGVQLDVAALEPIDGAALAAAVPPGELRERVIRAAVVAACIDGEASPDEVAVLEGFADALGVDRGPVRTARLLAHKHLLRARLAIARRALPGYKMRQTLREGGPWDVVEQMLPMFGVGSDALAARYQALGALPEGTLGRAYHDFVRAGGFPLPGEVGAGPEIIVLHDCIHVLGEYGTTPEEEIQVAAFQAACHGGDPFYALLFGLAQFHLGLQVAPVSPPETLRADPDLMLRAFARGCAVAKDLWGDFAPQAHFERPLAELRRELNIAPR